MKMLKVMKWVLPVIQSAAKEILDETVLQEMESSFTLLKNYAGMMPGIKYDETGKDIGSHWGGLDRVVTPGGHILWLCKGHAREYK